jgi:hypothetical protein
LNGVRIDEQNGLHWHHGCRSKNPFRSLQFRTMVEAISRRSITGAVESKTKVCCCFKLN